MSKNGSRPGSLRISGTGLPGGTKVELDGENVSDVLTGLRLRIGLDGLPSAVLDVVLHDLSTELEDPEIVVPETTRALLVQLGWTPPGEQQGDES